MKYVLIDQSGTNWLGDEFDDVEKGLKHGEMIWSHKTNREKEQCEAFYLLESVNPDEEAPNHYDGNPVKEWK